MSLPALEPFTGTGALSASWTSFSGEVVSTRVNDKLANEGTFGADAYSYWNADAFGVKHYAQLVLGAAMGSDGPAVGVNMSGTSTADFDGYMLFRFATTIELFRFDDGVATSLGSRTITTVAGDVLRLEQASAGILRAKVNGVQQGADFSDSTYTTGAAGFATSDVSNDLGDDWEGGNLASRPLFRGA